MAFVSLNAVVARPGASVNAAACPVRAPAARQAAARSVVMQMDFDDSDGGSGRQYSDRRPPRDNSLQVYVGNVSWSTTDEALGRAFSNVGEIVDARIIKDKMTGRSRGFGFVTFANDEACDRAVQMLNGERLDGREIRVDRADRNRQASRPPPRRSFDDYDNGSDDLM
ncbi:Glycine-rich RNA-binding protein [Porphyridium purpureum]|uniref:Glycine-rich RNA-binding protein n=1 Tax=Porphyridium purpureum TaxID=35688 RepID=A0A5J4Z2A9_PORPP|nr:Glycine-rich RNA-binding protein [Porphyridium purpureum]|eukprot:POR1468..scf208_2